MVAYSFQPCFVTPIRVGLGDFGVLTQSTHPKRHTIRNERKRHARPGEELQLYCRQRHPSGFLIGRATCIGTAPIWIAFRQRRRSDWIEIGYDKPFLPGVPLPYLAGKINRPSDLREFARDDGFDGWDELRAFWSKHHPGVSLFAGRIIFWRAQ